MEKLAKILVAIALVCLGMAVIIKLNTLGQLLPARTPINWAKLADTALLFSIAVSLLVKKQ